MDGTNCPPDISCRSTTACTVLKQDCHRYARSRTCMVRRSCRTATVIPNRGSLLTEKLVPTCSPDHATIQDQQSAATLWYHDHAMGINRINIYAGMAGMYIIEDAEEDAIKSARRRLRNSAVIAGSQLRLLTAHCTTPSRTTARIRCGCRNFSESELRQRQGYTLSRGGASQISIPHSQRSQLAFLSPDNGTG